MSRRVLLRGLAVGAVLLGVLACGGREEAASRAGESDATAPHFLVGTAKANHDPQARLCVGGGATLCGRSVDPGVEGAIRDTLWARAMAITGDNGESFILITTTNIGYFLAYKDDEGGEHGIYQMRLRIAEATGVDSRHIVVVSDHSHNGPDTIGLWGGVEADYKAITADAVVTAAIAAFEARQPAVLRVAALNQNDAPLDGVPRLDSSYNGAPGHDPAAGNPANEFRLLVADHAVSGERLLSFINYAPHATVLNGAATDQLSGDWAAWAPQEAEALFGGFGLAAIGSVGATDWNKIGEDADAKEAEARARLRLLLSSAQDQLQAVQGVDVEVASVFIREPITQPVLLANYKPRLPTNTPGSPAEHYDVRIDRAMTPPFLQGTLFGTYVSAIRLGEVFLSTFPGEPFGELEYAMRTGVSGPQAHFLLGAANDFFGYMVHRDETYQMTFETGALWIAGCPEQEFIYEPLGVPHDGGCADHWALMVSPTIGQHIVCSLQNAAESIRFAATERHPRCGLLTALDGVAPPAESDTEASRRAAINATTGQRLQSYCAQQNLAACAAM